jgi:phosphoglycerate dehydrogenase-like enzyme
MITVTLPTSAMCAQLDLDRDLVRAIPWDLTRDSEHAAEIDAVLLPNYFDSNEGFARLSWLPQLRFVQLPSAGYDRAISRLPTNVVVANGRGIHDAETAEFAIALTLASLRGIDSAVESKDKHEWSSVLRPSLTGRRVLLVGFGAIGQAIARRLAPFEVELSAVGRTARSEHGVTVSTFAELPALLPTADVVIVTVPLDAGTHHLVDADFLAALPYGARLINISRGGVIDTDALLAALTARRIFAALDVTEPEPLPAAHPLWDAPNLILTPHIAGKTTDTEGKTLDLFRRQLTLLLAGEPLRNVISS